jgi:diguanylate cyclase (GGDEF)-like protein
MRLYSHTPDVVATILVVDDDEASLRLAGRVLRAAGHTVLTASAPDDALAIAADRRQPLDLLITDLVMPRMSGDELAERVDLLRPGLPVLCVSGARDQHSGSERRAFLLKPFEGDALLAAVVTLIDRTAEAADAGEGPVAVPVAPRPTAPATRAPAAARGSRRARTGGRRAEDRRRHRLQPGGRTLPAAEWERRHRLLVLVLWAHALALAAAGIVVLGVVDGLACGGALVPFAALAAWPAARRVIRALALTLGLLTASAVIVGLSGGAPEAYFHYFLAIVLLSLYEEWPPFAVAIAYVVAQHAVVGALGRDDVFRHAEDPWRWGALHAAAITVTAIAASIAWRLNEDVRRTESQVRDRLAHRALHDELTGLPNRRLLIEELERTSARCAAGDGGGAAVLFADIDQFKLINDSFGHHVGDRLLIDVANRIRGAVRATDLVARAGGDEFVVVAHPAESDEEALAIAARIGAAMRIPIEIAGVSREVTLSVGVSRFSREDHSVGEALGRADAAMYRAKFSGRGRFRLADPEVLAESRRRMAIESALNASTRDEFHLRYQPIVDLGDGSVAAVEALLRWHHPVLGDVTPAEFVHLAEGNGRIQELGRWALELAAAQAVRWDVARGRPMKVFVNVAANQLTHPDFARVVVQALQGAGADGSHLALELTERALAEGAIPPATLAALAAAGVDLVLDDFGTGFSSLDCLSRFPVSMIKLDGTFLARDAHDPAGLAIVDAVAHLARGLRLPALAEGVETRAHLAHVQARGYAFAQGHLFAPAVPAGDLDRLMLAERPFASLLAVAPVTRLAS